MKKAINVLEITESIIADCKSKKVDQINFIESIFAQYLAVIAYSEAENTLGSIIKERLEKIEDDKISNFIIKTNEQMIKRVPKGDIAKTSSYFGADCKNKFNENCSAQDVHQYNTLIQARHNTAHPGQATATLSEIRNGIKSGETILELFREAIRK